MYPRYTEQTLGYDDKNSQDAAPDLADREADALLRRAGPEPDSIWIALGSYQTIGSQGMIHGGVKYALAGAWSGASETVSAMPAIVPRTVATLLATKAISRELRAASSMAWSCHSRSYQSTVKPTHSAFKRESLKENSTTTASGR